MQAPPGTTVQGERRQDHRAADAVASYRLTITPHHRATEAVDVRLDHLDRQARSRGAQPDRGAAGGAGGPVGGLPAPGRRGRKAITVPARLHRHADRVGERSGAGNGRHHGAEATATGHTANVQGRHPCGDDLREGSRRTTRTTRAGTDIDLAVSLAGVARVRGGATAEEAVNLVNPTAGTYTVAVTYFAGATPTLAMKLNSFALTSAAGRWQPHRHTGQPGGHRGCPGHGDPRLERAWRSGARYLGTVT